MVRQKLYPNYTNFYYYDKGNQYIKLIRTDGIKVIYKDYFNFNNEQEALQYFETECGA